MKKKTVVFLGSKPIGYACFRMLLEQQEALGIEIAGLLTQARTEFEGSSDLTALAGQYGVPVLSGPDALPSCDLLYSVQYHRILTKEQLQKATVAVNLHMAPLPEYRGSNQFSYAIIEGKKEFGTTVHLMDPRIDHGAILFQQRFPIPEGCWVNDLYRLTFDASVMLFRDTLPSLVAGDYTPVPQAALETQYGTSLHFRSEIGALKELRLDWEKEKIERHIRATWMPGFEPPYFLLDGRKLYLTTREA